MLQGGSILGLYESEMDPDLWVSSPWGAAGLGAVWVCRGKCSRSVGCAAVRAPRGPSTG